MIAFSIYKPKFIAFNTSLYNTPNIKTSIFLTFHLNIFSLLFFIHFLNYFSLFLCHSLPLSLHLSQQKLLPLSDICSQNLHSLSLSSSSPLTTAIATATTTINHNPQPPKYLKKFLTNNFKHVEVF